MSRQLLNLLTALSLLICVALIAMWVDAAIAVKRFRDQFGSGVSIHDSYATVEVAGNNFALPAAVATTAVLPLWRATWLAARWQTTRRRRRAGLCPSCGYNLTGNVSGVCPECGAREDRTGGEKEAGEPT